MSIWLYFEMEVLRSPKPMPGRSGRGDGRRRLSWPGAAAGEQQEGHQDDGDGQPGFHGSLLLGSIPGFCLVSSFITIHHFPAREYMPGRGFPARRREPDTFFQVLRVSLPGSAPHQNPHQNFLLTSRTFVLKLRCIYSHPTRKSRGLVR